MILYFTSNLKKLDEELAYFKTFLILILLGVIYLSGCADKSKWANRIEWPELSLSELPGEQDFPDEGAVVLYDLGQMEIRGQNHVNRQI